eukprot:TRINITY_DN35387_c0_g1_i1.p1 TRINITY_DN35387_c0_g1~~TRINITY_DN35387_c0_g1_i1.p1  ORF type:complete len:171 (-),score=32.23 TRINITY_DN35387_c0_g1_i1:35-547(-)
MTRRPPRSTLSSSSAASDVYKRQNIFQDDYMHLMDDDTFIGNREDSFLVEKGNFSHVWTRGRQVSCVDWHSSRPRDDTVVVSTTAILPLQDRLEEAGACKANLSLVWDLNDPMHPKYILELSLIHISEPTRLLSISYAVFCLKKKKNTLIYIYIAYSSPTINSIYTYLSM